MTRDEAITHYRQTRAGIQRVLKAAVATCTRADVTRAAKHLGVWANDRIEVEEETAIDMVTDLALFEPNRLLTASLRPGHMSSVQITSTWLEEWLRRGSQFSV